MSPQQKKDMLGSGYAHIMPSLVDPDKFSPGSGEGYLWVGNYSRQKGIRNLWEWAEANQAHIDCYGYGTPRVYLEQSEYCHVKVPVPNNEMPVLYKDYSVLVHLPSSPEAGSRVFIESILSGLEVITNEHEGDLSYVRLYDKNLWRVRLQKAPQEFWQKTLQVLE